MCGIAGIYDRGGGPVPEHSLLAMRGDQAHRGPDDSGLRIAPGLGLAFNRLAIIDLSPAAGQPMASGDGRLLIVFNGEIYNFLDLRRELEARGQLFRTRSDTEVILEGYRAWGIDVVPRLNGMFAFALWDGARERLHLVRDRLGKKPLFYCDAGGKVVFASEVRALLKGLDSRPEIDDEVVDRFLTYQCVPGERSIWRGVRKVPPAHILTFDRGGVAQRRYWRLSFREKEPLSEGEALERLDAILDDATRIRMISDVPIGAFLSGGVDSSTVVALMSRAGPAVRTFSVGFADQQFNELPHARAVAAFCGTRHTELVVEPDAAAVLPRLVWHYGEPFADASAVPTYYVAEAARRHVTVVLNGDGGDEGFAGYPWHRTVRIAALYRRAVPGLLRRGFLAPLARGVAGIPGAPGAVKRLARLLGHWGAQSPEAAFWIWPGLRPADRRLLYTPEFQSRLGNADAEALARQAFLGSDSDDDLDRGLQAGLETYLPDDLLVKMDIASMARSLEARSPLLDYRLLEFTARLPSSLRMRRLRTKYLLKRFAARLVPPEVVYRRKQGFSVPLERWLRGPLRRPMEVVLEDGRLARRGYFQAGTVRAWMRRHQAGEDHSGRLWALLWLELWFRMFVDGELRKEDSLHDLS